MQKIKLFTISADIQLFAGIKNIELRKAISSKNEQNKCSASQMLKATKQIHNSIW